MPKVDFYVLSEKHTPDQFVCQLVQKIWQQGHQVYIHTDHEEQASQLDTRLWTYSDISFLPHQIYTSSSETNAPISIGWQHQFAGNSDVMINLNHAIPAFCHDFARIVEIVTLDEANKNTGRAHFRDYREKGYEIESHNL